MTKKYKVIIADPPWSYENDKNPGSAASHYNTMSIDEICALPVSKLAHKDCVLFLWGCNPLLPEALRVVESWGFEFKTALPWVKVHDEKDEDHNNAFFDFVDDFTLTVKDQLDNKKLSYGQGFWVKACTEYILICVRGKVKSPKEPMLGLISNRFEHSRKPNTIHDLAMGLPGPRLEMFARREYKGFDVWGNQAPNSVDIFNKKEIEK